MSEREKKWQRIYDLLNHEIKLKFTNQRKKNYRKRAFHEKVGGVGDWTKNEKKAF